MKKSIKKSPSRVRPLFSFGLSPEERGALDKAAAQEDRSAAYVARRAVVEWLKAEGFLK